MVLKASESSGMKASLRVTFNWPPTSPRLGLFLSRRPRREVGEGEGAGGDLFVELQAFDERGALGGFVEDVGGGGLVEVDAAAEVGWCRRWRGSVGG